MEINTVKINMSTNDRSSLIKEGEHYHAKIESRMNEREAVISIRGQEVKATFSGKVPDGDRVFVKVEERTGDGIKVSVSENSRKGGEKPNASAQEKGAKDPHIQINNREFSPELRSALQRFSDNNIPLTRESVQDLKQYFSQKGDAASRAETVDHLINKGLPPTSDHLRAVHEALHGRSVHEHIQSIKDTNSSTSQYQTTVTSSTVEGTGHQAQRKNDFHVLLAQWAKNISNEPNILLALENVRSDLWQSSFSTEAVQLINEALNKAVDSVENGRELKGRQLAMNAIQQVEQMISAQAEASNPSREEALRYISNEIQQKVTGASKDILITQVTERLASATDEFKAFQRDTSRQLARISILMNQFKAQSVQQVKPMLETVIRQLDQTLLKQDWLLYADMKTEKSVLEASSRLAEAKNLLNRGDHHQANQIVREVQQQLDKILFKPSSQKVMHYMKNEQEWHTPRPDTHRLNQLMDTTTRSLTYNDGSPRNVFEGIRTMGLTRESEIAQMLSSGREQMSEGHQRNLKSILLQMQNDSDGNKQSTAQQALQNITGQQLLSRSEHQQNMQMLMLQLPILLKGQSENLQVYVNSKKNGEKVDWENCSLYFLIETKKMGEVGISLNVTERALQVTLKNDQVSFKEKVEPIALKYIERLKEVGFYVQGLQFSKLNEEEAPVVKEKEQSKERFSPTLTKKGFDFKV
ncbi:MULTISPECIES: hypothetical protein [Bacillaceae]|uniref:Flagellar hook-length control protein FliK n=1 Tax=Evansella alkalicola TaxID=745819 RepID=A0ABS6JZQ6_9BACI|nr:MULTISPECIES: hypothetical protein [Bacillaceae]MBU9724076.1 hypothetical protein [Bacillus alkalicola]